jgi:hypothetical protein
LRRVPPRRAQVVASALVVIACGCSGGSGKTVPTTTVRPPTSQNPTTTSTRPTPTTDTIPGPELEPLIVDTAPSGLERKPDALADTGPTDLDKAVQDDALSRERDARRALALNGFLRGYQRQWSTGDGVGQNFVYVYQFATPEGAAAYLSHWRSAAIAGTTRAAPVPFTPSLPGAIGLNARDNRGSSGIVLFSKGPYAVQAISTGISQVDQAQPATDLAFAQYARLP